jgi:hypothetical protein
VWRLRSISSVGDGGRLHADQTSFECARSIFSFVNTKRRRATKKSEFVNDDDDVVESAESTRDRRWRTSGQPGRPCCPCDLSSLRRSQSAARVLNTTAGGAAAGLCVCVLALAVSAGSSPRRVSLTSRHLATSPTADDGRPAWLALLDDRGGQHQRRRPAVTHYRADRLCVPARRCRIISRRPSAARPVCPQPGGRAHQSRLAAVDPSTMATRPER